ncbi:MAG: UDP-N-acetylmuramoyl-L-alanyl-D-glutamate--2,6-diaminopimelate ligase [Gammaproteobacteria bacterium]|nr:UDP-N-acetylmuramoyl-L-alanyl-D-glutamate--2,6-diaminopimelate ligase [Gammaproteobacteria bacterium]
MSMPAEHLITETFLDVLLERLANAPALPVVDIASDSRRLKMGSLFLACEGATHHGLDFWEPALEAGAVAIAYDSSTATKVPGDIGIPLVPVANLANHLGEIANRFFGSPSEQLEVVGVTGTNGKSSVAWMIAQSLDRLGRKCAYAGTLGYGIGEIDSDDNMTTPDVIEMHRRLATFRDNGADHAAVEVSSHALDQRRVDGVRFHAALFTNLTRDHLDYHGSMRAYGDAKAKLFVEHRANNRIINLDSEFGSELAARCGNDVITVSTKFDRVANGRPFVFVRSIITQATGSRVHLQTSWGNGSAFVPLPGDFNIANAVLVLAYLLADNFELEDACAALAELSAPPGRMQRVAVTHGPAVYIDYAHTPNALDHALRALRAHCRANVWCVFGCGGDRDAGKRPLMARIAERLADRVVICNDNPRSEPPAKIVDDILAGLTKTDTATVIEDRAAAIAWAIANADASDVVLIAGKGHENYQIIGNDRLDFSDYDAALGNLEALRPEGRA